MQQRMGGLLAAAILAVATPASAQAPPSYTQGTDKVYMGGRRPISITRPGYALGDYGGTTVTRRSSMSIGSIMSRDSARTRFTIGSPELPELTGECGGMQKKVEILWITFDEDDFQYACTYRRGETPATDVALDMVLAKGSILQKLRNPMRAGEFRWGERTYRFESRYTGPFFMGGVAYVISRDGREVGALEQGGLRPTFYLPPKGSPDRDPVSVLAMSLFHFQEPEAR